MTKQRWWKSLRARYHLLKEVMNLLGVLDWIAMLGGLYYLIEREPRSSLLLIALMIIFSWGRDELNYYVNQLQIRLELEKK